jgi:cell division protein FtsI/penicillin-binding protein 2
VSPLQYRIGRLGIAFAAVTVLLLGHLALLMLVEHPVWAQRSHQNRWAFRAVPSLRGPIVDRHGEVLAADEPTTTLSVYYLRFRQWHPVGAAVHAATLWQRQVQPEAAAFFGYRDGPLGPEAACRELLATEVASLRRGVLDREVAGELRTLWTTVLAASSGWSRRDVARALREAAARGDGTTVGAALPGVTAAQLAAAFASRWQSLGDFDADLARAREQAPGALFAELERLREASLEQARVVRRDENGEPELGADGKPKLGDLVETIAWPFAHQVPFALAARLRTGPFAEPGLEITADVLRTGPGATEPSLRALVGTMLGADQVAGAADWVDRSIEREYEAGWLDELVPAQALAEEEGRGRLQAGAAAALARAMLLQERRGVSGVEAACDGELSGRMGIRLVERNAARREVHLWSRLGAARGAPVALTLDRQLQRCAEAAVQKSCAEFAALHSTAEGRGRVGAGLAVLDARTGEILAVAGAPVVGDRPRGVPGIGWRGNGALGSLVKPFVLVEQLLAEAAGTAARPLAEFEPCGGKVLIGGRRLGCAHGHGEDGRDPERALAKSCNSFFFQVADSVGTQGLRRALQRFGLLPGEAGQGLEAWLPAVRGIAVVRPRWVGQTEVRLRAIGYGCEASTVEVARAYAGFATGALPPASLLLGEHGDPVPLAGIERELEVVRAGLEGAVTFGTARGIGVFTALSVRGKTGTAEVGGPGKENNAWFAGYLPEAGADGAQLCFCAVVYWVPNGVHGGDAAAHLVADWLYRVRGDATLAGRYLPQGGR